MPICQQCGQRIEFRYVNGVRTPIHVNGNWCRNNQSEAHIKESPNGSNSYSDFCSATQCPECGDHVYFIRHNGGSVWVDALGWPWPKHACMISQPTPKWHHYIDRNVGTMSEEKYFCGIVIYAERLNDDFPQILLAIDGGNLGRVIVSTEANTTAKYLRGQFAVLKFKEKNIVLSTHDVKPMFDWGIAPNVMGMHDETWPTITKSNNLYP